MMLINAEDQDTLTTSDFFIVLDKDLRLRKDAAVHITVDPKKNSDGSFNVQLHSTAFIKDLALKLDDPAAEFSTNGIDLLAGVPATVRVKSIYSAKELESKLSFYCLNLLH
jgi:hypothetical protein